MWSIKQQQVRLFLNNAFVKKKDVERFLFVLDIVVYKQYWFI